MEMNQDYIVETLRNQGVPESEIQARLQRWEIGKKCYDPISGTYFRIPLPHEILPLEGDSKPSEVVNHDVNTESSVGEDAIDGELLRNNHLPIDNYGKLAKSLINEFSQAYKANADMIGAIVLLIVGSAANRKITLRAWNYINHPCFWLAIVERSGSNKSERRFCCKRFKRNTTSTTENHHRRFNTRNPISVDGVKWLGACA